MKFKDKRLVIHQIIIKYSGISKSDFKKQAKLFLIIITSIGILGMNINEAYADAAAPLVVSIQTTTTTQIVVTYDRAVTGTNIPAAWTVADNSVTLDVTAGLTTTLALGTAISPSDTPDVSYNAGVGDITDNEAPGILHMDLATFGPTPSTDFTTPTMDSATITSTTTIDVTFSEDLGGLTVEAADFTLDLGLTVLSAVESSPGVVTITTTTPFGSSAPAVTLGGTGVDDVSGNTLVAAGPLTSTSGIVASGGGGCENCLPPTLGLDKKGDKRLVEGGFTCQGQTADVEHYYTPFPLIQVDVGQKLSCSFKIYEDTGADNIRHFDLAFGRTSGSSVSSADKKITWDRNHLLEETVTYDESFFRDVSVTLGGLVKCKVDSTDERCQVINVSAVPKEPIAGDDIIVQTNVWDQRRNGKTNYYNDGIDVIGNTENPLPFYKMADGRNGVVLIFTTDPTLEDLEHGIDKYGQKWTLINGNSWVKDYVSPDRSCKTSSKGFERNCPEFQTMLLEQQLLAQQYFNSMDIQNELPDSFTYEYPDVIERSDDSELQKRIEKEKLKALHKFNQLYDIPQ